MSENTSAGFEARSARRGESGASFFSLGIGSSFNFRFESLGWLKKRGCDDNPVR
jgi:hypothetical protein